MRSLFHQVLPAYAGMIPIISVTVPVHESAPRIRGDDPYNSKATTVTGEVLPAYAGMIPYGGLIACAITLVLPAYAGMIPRERRASWRRSCAPRIRGDDPSSVARWVTDEWCSPHTRG